MGPSQLMGDPSLDGLGERLYLSRIPLLVLVTILWVREVFSQHTSFSGQYMGVVYCGGSSLSIDGS